MQMEVRCVKCENQTKKLSSVCHFRYKGVENIFLLVLQLFPKTLRSEFRGSYHDQPFCFDSSHPVVIGWLLCFLVI